MPIIKFNECVGDCYFLGHNFSPHICQFISLSTFFLAVWGFITIVFLIWFIIILKHKGVKWKHL